MDLINRIMEEKKECTVKKVIKVGRIIPNEITFYHKKGSGWLNMSSFWMTHLFKKELRKLQDHKYEFSSICRNRKEKKALYNAITYDLNELGYKVKYHY